MKKAPLSLPDLFVALDVEVASKKPLLVCSIGATRVERGREVARFRSVVRVLGKVRYGHIHLLTEDELRTAPLWPTVWAEFLRFTEANRHFVAYNAAFDRAAILSMCARYGLRPPAMEFHCAAEMAELVLGKRLPLKAAITELNLVFPGRHHEALSDARAAAAVVQAIRERQERTSDRRME